MSASGTYLPAPPQAIANTPSPQEQMNAGNAQFNALLKLISGGAVRRTRKKTRASRYRKNKTPKRKSRKGTRRRHRHRSRHRRRSGGTTIAQPLAPQKIEVSTVPAKGTEVAYPSTTDMQVKLAATISQNGANGALDNPSKVST